MCATCPTHYSLIDFNHYSNIWRRVRYKLGISSLYGFHHPTIPGANILPYSQFSLYHYLNYSSEMKENTP
jgi:hypothetical protein